MLPISPILQAFTVTSCVSSSSCSLNSAGVCGVTDLNSEVFWAVSEVMSETQRQTAARQGLYIRLYAGGAGRIMAGAGQHHGFCSHKEALIKSEFPRLKAVCIPQAG